jgi:hypothetical protein
VPAKEAGELTAVALARPNGLAPVARLKLLQGAVRCWHAGQADSPLCLPPGLQPLPVLALLQLRLLALRLRQL